MQAGDLVERLYDAFNRRDVETVVSLAHPDVEFRPVTAEFAGRQGPYTGHDGLRLYFQDVAAVWEELLVTPQRVRARDDVILVTGRVYARGRRHGIRDMPAVWVWRLEEGRLRTGTVYGDLDEALAALAPNEGPPVPG
jgi:ketosteroid isomerase-like protein